jgi:hypothetical protein
VNLSKEKEFNNEVYSNVQKHLQKSWVEHGFNEDEQPDAEKLLKKMYEPYEKMMEIYNSGSTSPSLSQQIAIDAYNKREKERKEDIEIANKQTEYLKENVTLLKEMNYHLELNNAHQREIIDLMIEALSIMKSDNEKEAESKRDNFIGKVQSLNTLRDSAETAKWLIGLAKSAYVMYQSLS